MWITVFKPAAGNQVLGLSAPASERVIFQAVLRMSSAMWTSVKFAGGSSFFQKMMSLLFVA